MTNNVLLFTRPAPSAPKRSKPKRSRTTPKNTRTAPAVARRRRTHFVDTHPLAEAVRYRCRELGHRADPGRYIGKVGCDECWEAAIRADERFAIENDLDDAEPVPADDLDEIALEKAMRGVRVPLTEHERNVAIFRLYAASLTDYGISKRLHIAQRDVAAVLDPFADDNETADDFPAALAA